MLRDGIFNGLKVAEFSWVQAGPMGNKPLFDFGATVVRIESMQRPDLTRMTPPFKDKIPGVDRSGNFCVYGSNRYSLALDLNNPRAKEVLDPLIKWADVITENFRPGTMRRWGLDYESVRKVNPGAIYVSASIQGQTGPHSRQPGWGIMAAALGGFVSIHGWPDRIPATLFTGYTDVVLPLFTGVALLAALDYRRRTGKGQYLDVSQLEAPIAFLAPLAMDYVVNGHEPQRMGNSSIYAAPHGVFRCRGDDRWCAIAVFTQEEWESFIVAIGNPEWAKRPEFSTFQRRKSHEEELNRLVEEWTVQRDAEEVMHTLQKHKVAAGVVQNTEDLFSDPQLNERDQFWLADHPVIGPVHAFNTPYRLSRTPAKLYRRSPLLGEHTEMVCKEMLGFSESQFADLMAEDVFN